MANAEKLVCLPHGGAGASVYRAWRDLLLPETEVVPVQLPGREARFAEPPVRSAKEAVDALLETMLELAGENFALFGHSLGALLAFELAHEAVQRGHPPVHLFVSACAAPFQLPRLSDVPVHTLPDAELLSYIVAQGGIPANVLNSAELMRVLLPVLRADYEVFETYAWPERPPLPIPITAFGGTEDPRSDLVGLSGWQALTAEFALRRFPGGHFYLFERPELVTDAVVATLSDP